MTVVAVLMPTTGRAEQAAARLAGLTQSGQNAPDDVLLRVFCSVPRDDTMTLAALPVSREVTVVTREPGTTAVDGWVQAFDCAYDAGADWFVLGADDICWHPDWLYEALLVAAQTGADVIGLNDGGHTDLNDIAPHYMMSRRHAERYEFIPLGYQSWHFDREVCEVAKLLGVYAPAPRAVAAHYHPDWGLAEVDATYLQGMPRRAQDKALYEARRSRSFDLEVNA